MANRQRLYENIMRTVSKQVKKSLDEAYIDDPVMGNLKTIKDLKRRNDIPKDVLMRVDSLLDDGYSRNITFVEFLDELDEIIREYQ